MKRARAIVSPAPLPARITVRVPITVHRRGGRKHIISPVGSHSPLRQGEQVENAVVKALAKAFRWRAMIESGQYDSITELARAERVNQSYASRILRLTLLSPRIVETLLESGSSSENTLAELIRRFPRGWLEQEIALQTQIVGLRHLGTHGLIKGAGSALAN